MTLTTVSTTVLYSDSLRVAVYIRYVMRSLAAEFSIAIDKSADSDQDETGSGGCVLDQYPLETVWCPYSDAVTFLHTERCQSCC